MKTLSKRVRILAAAAAASAALSAAPALAQNIQTPSPADEAAIRAAALDYIEGWYTGDAARMERAVHPDLVKRIVVTAPPGISALNTMNSYELVWEHDWQPGDLVLWDNMAMQHARPDVDKDGPVRTLRKVIAPKPQIAIEKPTFDNVSKTN